jgi:hypothetical protein
MRTDGLTRRPTCSPARPGEEDHFQQPAARPCLWRRQLKERRDSQSWCVRACARTCAVVSAAAHVLVHRCRHAQQMCCAVQHCADAGLVATLPLAWLAPQPTPLSVCHCAWRGLAAVIFGWKEHTPNEAEQPGADFLAMNKLATMRWAGAGAQQLPACSRLLAAQCQAELLLQHHRPTHATGCNAARPAASRRPRQLPAETGQSGAPCCCAPAAA